MLKAKTLLKTTIVSVSIGLLSACSTAVSEDVVAEAPMMKKESHAHGDNHAPFGHASAQYVCGGKELLTNYAKTGMTLTYDGSPTEMMQSSTEGERLFNGELNGQNVSFNGASHAAEFRLGNELMQCEKITCVPLDVPL